MKNNQEKQTKWNFDNSYVKLPKFFFTRINPIPVCNPKLIIINNELAASLGVPSQPEVFAGNKIPQGSEPLAQAYAGHQFGHFTMLGDGRAILLGEQITNTGERFDIQLKGSGRTPYSRSGDGRAALSPMLREYVISEAMYGLGIPTTRSLAVVTTGESVLRKKKLQGAILTRVASSHIRVGTFEYAAYFGSIDDLRCLADYTIQRHFSHIEHYKNKYVALLSEVVKRQASLIASWQLVGFIHGVMNTDNMAISGETIDYGPCAFMDIYDPTTVFSSIDIQGRYSFENQPKMAAWNLARFAETLLILLHDDKNEALKLASAEIAKFQSLYRNYWLGGMRVKLGLFDEKQGDDLLINELLTLMQRYEADYTNTFRFLTLNKKEDLELLFKRDLYHWSEQWYARLNLQGRSKSEVMKLMKSYNPAIIPRNQQVEEALASAKSGSLIKMNNLLRILSKPYEYTPEQEEYSKLPISASCCYQTFCGT